MANSYRRRIGRHTSNAEPSLLAITILGGLALLSCARGTAQDADTAPAAVKQQQQPTSRPTFVQEQDGELVWPRPRTDERQNERDHMVDTQIAHRVRDQRVLAALRSVPRHKFVAALRQQSAYADTPLPIGHGQTISQPYIVALMTELLHIEPGEKVLEIGTGSGYQAAVLNELTPYVFTIEIVQPLYKQVVQRFAELGHRTIQARRADGYDGWPEEAPFDAIIVTCAAGHVPPPLWEQLKSGGRMVIPLGGVHDIQRLVVLTKLNDGRRRSENVLPVRFVPMTGRSQEQ